MQQQDNNGASKLEIAENELIKAAQKLTTLMLEQYESNPQRGMFQKLEQSLRDGVLEAAFMQFNGNQSKAAAALGINRSTLRNYAIRAGMLFTNTREK